MEFILGWEERGPENEVDFSFKITGMGHGRLDFHTVQKYRRRFCCQRMLIFIYPETIVEKQEWRPRRRLTIRERTPDYHYLHMLVCPLKKLGEEGCWGGNVSV
jgi:hypothetical protein